MLSSWLAYDKLYKDDAIEFPDDALLGHQEGAYTSPIWCKP